MTLASLIFKDAQEGLRNNQSTVKMYQLSIGDAEVFIEVIQLPGPLVIFGAGHDAIPVVRFAKELGWNVTVVDSRQSSATSAHFLAADAFVVSRPEDICDTFGGLHQSITITPRVVAVVMTHNYLQDRELLKMLLPSPIRYLGILGPKSRTERLLRELLEQGVTLTENNLNRLYAPVGIDIGADNQRKLPWRSWLKSEL